MTGVMKKLSDWIEDVLLANLSEMPARIADEDCTWYISNGLGAEHLKLESSIGTIPDRKMVIV